MPILVYNGSAEPEEARKQNAKSKDKMEVYLAIGEGERGASGSTNVPLSQIKLENVPLFTSDDILHYDTDSDRFILNDKAYEAFRQLRVPVHGRTFVLMVGKRRVYRGALWWDWSSWPFDGVVIVQRHEVANSGLQLQLGFHKEDFTGQDPRHDPEVLSILKDAGKTSGLH